MTTSELVRRLRENGDLRSPEWERAMGAAPRHLFVPDRAWCTPDGAPFAIDRFADPERWREAAYADAAIVTQVDDGAGDPASGRGARTSSLSAPGVVVSFLELLAPRDHDRVLEIGTGTGWTAALLSSRLGAGRVTSVEVDERVAETAAANLREAGFAPDLVIGDGEKGVPARAPFDRVHVTCGVTALPLSWVEQTRPGGMILFPWMPSFGDGHKARLTVTGDGHAIGRFHGSADYMMLRSQRSPGFGDLDRDGEETRTRLDPRTVTGDSDVAIAGMLPDVLGAERIVRGRPGLVLVDEAGTSWARCSYRAGADDFPVVQGGERRLWDEVEAAYLRWVGWGSPGRDRFGLVAGVEGQRVWLDRPSNVI
ncbi:methyltransferase domain-containing protein [Actinomadura nitritigenes]|uniref:methyltransferase domain-containing protein n=1 Tax=Actinomadura nitritigenes TaxID=134602 RepID=UPI003D936571